MRLLLAALLAFSTTAAFGQNKDPVTGSPIYTEWQLAEFAANANKCFKRYPGRLQNTFSVRVTVGADGMIVGEPEVVAPIDNKAFRADVETARKKLRACQPYFVDPFRRVRGSFIQVFNFLHEQPHPKQTVASAIQATFDKCWKRPRTGPTIWLGFSYRPDGKMNYGPRLVNAEKTEEYSRAASDLLRQIEKCPPVQFPKGVDVNPDHLMHWAFESSDTVASRSRDRK